MAWDFLVKILISLFVSFYFYKKFKCFYAQKIKKWFVLFDFLTVTKSQVSCNGINTFGKRSLPYIVRQKKFCSTFLILRIIPCVLMEYFYG